MTKTKIEWSASTVVVDRGGRRTRMYRRTGDLTRPGQQERRRRLALGERWCRGCVANVWLGVSVEDQKRADLRIPALLETPAAVRFLSCEPLLGPVDLDNVDGLSTLAPDWAGSPYPGSGTGARHPLLDWVIAGGESGAGARPMHPQWARQLRDQCQAAGVPFFFKQWGEWVHRRNSVDMVRVCKKQAGRLLDGQTWDQFPAVVSGG